MRQQKTCKEKIWELKKNENKKCAMYNLKQEKNIEKGKKYKIGHKPMN